MLCILYVYYLFFFALKYILYSFNKEQHDDQHGIVILIIFIFPRLGFAVAIIQAEFEI